MTAVSQSYPNYLGGLNEQPDELKKPGQLVEALNVIPDPVIGLSRRPGFKLINQSKVFPGELDVDPDIDGTWFEIEYTNQVNNDFIYFGNIKKNGDFVIYNQDGVKQAVRYSDRESIIPSKKYVYDDDKLLVKDDVDKTIQTVNLTPTSNNGYFKHEPSKPIKYCVSKNNIIFTNPKETPTLNTGLVASTEAQNKYYSFINLKVVDTANYNYIFKVFGPVENIDTYREIKDIDVSVDKRLEDEYDTDLSLPLQVNSPFVFELEPKTSGGSNENATIEVYFTGKIENLGSNEGDGTRQEARYPRIDPVIITPGKGFKKGEKYTITKDKSELGGPTDLTFTFIIEDVNTVTATANKDANPDITTDDSVDQILRKLREKFISNENIDKAIIVGNGIYLESDKEFSVSTAEIAVADVMNSQKLEDDAVPIVRVTTVAELPTECYNSFIVEVSNSFDNKNNYYLKFVSETERTSDIDRDTTLNYTKSDGYWEEIAKPYEPTNIRDGSMPHMLTIAEESDQTRFVFIVSKIRWLNRTAGTIKDNPSMFVDRANITGLNYYKNRLFFFTDSGSVISSRAGEIDNLFLNTAVSTSLIDPIDITANSNQRVPIHESIVVNNGMVLFGDTEQYMLTTQSDLLTSETANITKVSNYTFDSRSAPIYVGSNIGFVSSGMTRFYEMTNLYDRGPVDINERSQQIQTRFGSGFNMPASSREQSSVFIYKSGAVSNDLILYRFRQENSQDSSQTAWVRWQTDSEIGYVSLPSNYIFMFVKDDTLGCRIYRMDSSVIEGLPANSTSLVPKFTDGYTDTEGGAPFESIIKFPTIYAQSKGSNPVSDTTANLTIHRVKLSTAAVGTYNLTIERKGYDTYNLLVEQTPSDEYRANFPTLYGEKIETVPVYTRNKNLTLTMSTSEDAPMTLQSMTWEGDWNRPYYKSV